jgi:uncharacterized coiled-coil DUF342 family protein
MNRAGKALAVMVVAVLGVWGCAQGNSGNADRLRSLENRCAKLEEDYRAVTAARDGLRKKVAALEEERTRIQQDLEAQQALARDRQTLVKERDELLQQVTTRTNERDVVQTQLEQVRKGLRNLLGQADAAAAGQAAPSVSALPEGGGQS